MESKKYLLLTAAGSGSRMGAAVPKQFLEIGGKSILHRTMEKFAAAVPGIRIVTVLPREHVRLWKEYCFRKEVLIPQSVAEGGISRFHSVRNGLERVPDGALVAIHDGVRPLVSEDLIKRMFSLAENVPALIPVMPSVDTLRALEKRFLPDGTVSYIPIDGVNPDRNLLYRVQTPQIFHSALIKEAYSQAYDVSFTDDASVAERYGIPLSFTEGESLNVKITTPEDLLFARAVMEK